MSFWDFFKKKNETRECTCNPISTAVGISTGTYDITSSSTGLSAVFAAIELISNSVAQMPIIIKRNSEIDKGHILNYVFKTGLISRFNLMKQLMYDVIVYGEAVTYIKRANDGTPTDLIYCEHGSWTQVYNQQKQELYYLIPFCEKSRIEPINVIHLYKNARNGVDGKSILAYAQNILKLAKYTDAHASNVMSGGCMPNLVLSTDDMLAPEDKEEIRNNYNKVHAGENGSNLLVLEGGWHVNTLSQDAAQSQLLESRKFNVTEIARFFNINPVLLGDNEGTSYNTLEAANLEFVTHTLMPYVSMIEEEFNRKLIKPSETDITIDLDEAYLLRADKSSMSNYLKNLTSAGIMTINEARTALGLPTKEGCDDLVIAYTDISQNTINKSDKDDANIDNIDNNDNSSGLDTE